MKIAIASDHGGYALKEEIKKYLAGRDIEVVDLGNDSEESVDIRSMAKSAAKLLWPAKRIAVSSAARGSVFLSRPIRGERHPLRARMFTAEMSRKHNDSNVLSPGGRTTPVDKALKSWEPGWTLNLREAAIREEWTCSTHKTAPARQPASKGRQAPRADDPELACRKNMVNNKIEI